MTENIENNGCSQRDSAEHEGYAMKCYNKVVTGVANKI